MAKKTNSNVNVPATVAPVAPVPTAPAAPARQTLSAEETSAIREEGAKFARLGWNKSDANTSADKIGRLLGERLKGTGRKLVNAIRAPFGTSDGALSVNGSYQESQDAFGRISPEAMGDHFVRATLAVLNGETLPAILGDRTRGARRGSL